MTFIEITAAELYASFRNDTRPWSELYQEFLGLSPLAKEPFIRMALMVQDKYVLKDNIRALVEEFLL